MKLKIIRELEAGNDKRELLLEVDEELLNIYRVAMSVEDFDQDSFSQWLESLVHYSSEGEDWKY